MIDLPSYLIGAASVVVAQLLWATGESTKLVGRFIRSDPLIWLGLVLMWLAVFALFAYLVIEWMYALARWLSQMRGF